MTAPHGSQPFSRPADLKLEIGALVALLSVYFTGPIGLVIGCVLAAQSRHWAPTEKRLAYVLAVPMIALFFQPWDGAAGVAIQAVVALLVVAMVIYLYRAAARAPGAVGAPTRDNERRRRPAAGTSVTAVTWVVIALAGLAAWWAWMGWDDTYQVDAQGVPSGPYEAWQVAGSAVTVLVIVLVARRWVAGRVVISALTLGYGIGWGMSSIPQDDSGLAFVGLFLVLAGVAGATSLIVVLADVVEKELSRT